MEHFETRDGSRESLRVEPLHAQQQEIILAEFRKRLPVEVDLHLSLKVASVLLIDMISLLMCRNFIKEDKQWNVFRS